MYLSLIFSFSSPVESLVSVSTISCRDSGLYVAYHPEQQGYS